MQTLQPVRKRFEDALESLLSRVRQDRYVIAAILGGSLSYDEVWEKSDIDLLLIGREEKKPTKDYCLVENGINIHAFMMPRSNFKELIERSLQSSFFHSFFSKSTLLFSYDDTIKEYYENIHHVGARDRELQLLNAASSALLPLAKAEKWLCVKKDVTYSFLWIMYTVTELAMIEVLLNSEVTGREVIQQALKHNPSFFKQIYFDLIHNEKDEVVIQEALNMINRYLEERIFFLFKPILEFLADASGPRSTTELDEYFKKKVQSHTLASAYEWLADKDIIQKVSAPLRLTEKSQVIVEEAAYYYDGGSQL